MPAKAPDINLENAIQAYLSGEAAQKVAPQFGICGKRLTAVLKERGLLRTREERYSIAGSKNGTLRHGTLQLPDAEIATRYQAGESEKALAQAFGVNRHAITVSLRITNTPRRTTEECGILRSSKIPLREREHAFKDHPEPHQQTWEQRCRAARLWEDKAAQGLYSRASQGEILLRDLLLSKGKSFTPQQAVGPYNVDLGAYPVAVEVWGGAFHFSRDHTERFRYLANQGWHLIIVYSDIKRSPITIDAANYIIFFLEQSRLDPAAPREYRVIWGNGEVFSAGRLDDDNIARIVPRKHFLGQGA